MSNQWSQDVLGEGFRCQTLELPPDDEGEVLATLVTSTELPVRPQMRVVLYLHGWSDYFHQRELARFWADQDVAFYALDLRKYGRSLRSWQTSGYITDLTEYDADIEAAIGAIHEDLRHNGVESDAVELSMMGHSTGGLVAALWVERHPDAVSALILNSPWLDFTGSALVRTATAGFLESIARIRPRTRIRLPELGFYWRSISATQDGEWDLDDRWRPQFAFPVTAGWLSAVFAGHTHVNRGLGITIPILVLTSATSTISPVWKDSMMTTDSVLDAELIRQKALKLGDHVTVVQVNGALHDVFLSASDTRQRAYQATRRWAAAYMVA